MTTAKSLMTYFRKRFSILKQHYFDLYYKKNTLIVTITIRVLK